MQTSVDRSPEVSPTVTIAPPTFLGDLEIVVGELRREQWLCLTIKCDQCRGRYRAHHHSWHIGITETRHRQAHCFRASSPYSNPLVGYFVFVKKSQNNRSVLFEYARLLGEVYSSAAIELMMLA